MRMNLTTAGQRRISMAAGCVVLALGAIVLARAQRTEADEPPITVAPMPAGPAPRAVVRTAELDGFVVLTQGAVLEHGTRELFAEVRLEARRPDGAIVRQPVALAIAVDTSG